MAVFYTPCLFFLSLHYKENATQRMPWVAESWMGNEKDEHLAICNEHGIICVISSDFGDRMTTQLIELMVLLSEYF